MNLGLTSPLRHTPRGIRHGNPPVLLDQENPTDLNTFQAGVEYNERWAGAVLSGSNFVSVTGNVVVGPATAPPAARSGVEYATTTWVGIDGTGCSTQALLQTGVDSYVSNGVTRYEGWYEWYPKPSIPFQNFPVKLRDEIRISVTATSPTSGWAALENLTTGKSVNHTFTNEARLCYQSAEWVVEDFYSIGASENKFANFTTVTFTNSSATLKDGTKKDTTGAQIFGIQHGSKIYTSCSVPNSATVTCTYT